MIPGIILALVVAVVDWIAVYKGWRKVEIIAKPATLLALFLGVMLPAWVANGFRSLPLLLVGAGLLFSLAGDALLLRLSTRCFLAGMGAFLLAHLAYITALNMPLPDISPVWSLGLAVLLSLVAARLLRRIIAGLRQKKLVRLVLPVAVYGVAITLMLLSALLTFYRTDWNTPAAGLVALGGSLFYLSDVLLAWNKFVAPIKNGRLANMIAYHIGQAALVAGVILQFGK
jgi:uncharacterized membrane protein YhhN